MSWQQLLDIGKENKAERQRQLTARPVACPDDGEPLSMGPGAALFCRYCGWRAGVGNAAQ